uniref:2,3-epoxybenzoyl-CoA dihydrolase n=1 Tax=Castellaniella defragrans TaxID=75697 RepID=UPI003340151D
MTSVPSHIEFRTDPQKYRHWALSFDGEVATLAMDVAEDGGLKPGYRLKLNSYDLGVDIELHDALQRIRFEHPEVRSVVITSLKDRIFCSGANIFMLGVSTHAWKVNFCKFTNETRNGIEDSSRYSGLKFVAALNGACAGGGYELALACDRILLIDDRSSAVSLPEVPLLGVLPGTGGLTRVTDKRKVRRDRADIFCTLVEGVRGLKAKSWRLVDELVKPARFQEEVKEYAQALAAGSDRPAGVAGVPLTPLKRIDGPDSLTYEHIEIRIDREQRVATWTLHGPALDMADDIETILAKGVDWWPLAFARELDDAILQLRTNETEIGTWLFRSKGDSAAVLRADQVLHGLAQSNWFVRETLGMLRRTLARLDVTSRSMFALIDQGSCFVGTLFEVVLACDRSYMLDDAKSEQPVAIGLSDLNFGAYPMVNGRGRLAARFYDEQPLVDAARDAVGKMLTAVEAESLGLISVAVDELDWQDEIRIAVEERIALSPDALTGLEANLRFGGKESMETRIFGRLTAWQNWIFYRPNASGDKGALKLYGKGEKADFDWVRI